MIVVLKISSSKLIATTALMTFILGAVAVFYSVNLFLANSSHFKEPIVLRVPQWSGYIVASDIQNRSATVSRVSASWAVPKINSSGDDTLSGVWVGIGGYGEETLIQTGTVHGYINGKLVYYAWYELLPDYLVRILSLHVRQDDIITASISLLDENTSTWSIEISDVTQGEQFKKVVVYNSSRLTAEWIIERPKVNRTISTLADFGNITFTKCKATVDGVTGSIGNFSYAQLVMYNEETPLVSVSSLSNDESGFTVNYLKSLGPTTSADDSILQNFMVQDSHAFLLRAKTAVSKRPQQPSGA